VHPRQQSQGPNESVHRSSPWSFGERFEVEFDIHSLDADFTVSQHGNDGVLECRVHFGEVRSNHTPERTRISETRVPLLKKKQEMTRSCSLNTNTMEKPIGVLPAPGFPLSQVHLACWNYSSNRIPSQIPSCEFQ
jgi:hypothetical protein